MRPHLRLVALALALAACGHGSSSGGTAANAVLFQAVGTTAVYGPTVNGPSAAASLLTAGTAFAASYIARPDVVGNTVTVTTDANGNLTTPVVTIGKRRAPSGGGLQCRVDHLLAGKNRDHTLAHTLAAVAGSASGANGALYQGVVAGLISSVYGVWMQSTGGGNFSAGTFGFGIATAAAAMPTSGSAIYTGTTAGYGANNATPFAFTGQVTANATFSNSNGVLSLTFNNFKTHDFERRRHAGHSDLGRERRLRRQHLNITNLAGGALAGSVNGAFYGTAAAESAGVWNAAGSRSRSPAASAHTSKLALRLQRPPLSAISALRRRRERHGDPLFRGFPRG